MIYTVGECVLDTSLYALRRAGQAIRLRPKVFQVLLYLLTHRDRVVTKHDLREVIWPGRFISDETLESTVSAVRQALGDSGRAQRLIQTLPGHGYRLVAPVTEGLETPDDAPEKPQSSTVPTPARAVSPGSLSPADGFPMDVPPILPSHRTAQGDVLASAPRASVAEHRQLTILCCRLLEATPRAGPHDLEAWHHVLRLAQDVCIPLVQRFAGQVAHNHGDGFLVYFGYPVASEDDAQRAVHTGLEIVAALHTLQARLAADQASRLAVRIAIHTGLALVDVLGGSAHQAPLAVGETPQLATGLVELAPPQTVLISAATYRLVHGYFATQALGAQMLQGVPEPVAVYRVLRAQAAQQRLDVAGTRFTPMVGRASEVAVLVARWQHVQAGHGQVVVLHGEAGIGKSRLVHMLKEHLVDVPHTHLECRSASYYQNTALYPIIDLLHRMLHWQRDETPAALLDKLVYTVQQCRLPVAETVPLLGALLALPVPPEHYPPLGLSPQQQRHKTLDTLLALLLEQAESQPVVVILEDLQWTDPTTLEFLGLLIDHLPAARMLLLLSGRLEFQPPWPSRSYLTQVTLLALSPGEVAQMVRHITGGKALPDEVLAHIVDKTDGIPLFVEELTKTWLESGYLTPTEASYALRAPVSSLAMPTTLRDLLMARLDRLGSGKDVAQCGAILGRSFPYAWIQGLAPCDEATLQQALARLVAAELLYCRGHLPHATYIFKHALIQDIAYQSLLTSTRQQYHEQVARLLEQRFAATSAHQPELLAHHYTMAGCPEQALPYWQRAGEDAVARSANVEAISHFTKGLEVLQGLPVTTERHQHELRLQLALSMPLQMIKGAAQLGPVSQRIVELCHALEDQVSYFSGLASVWRFLLNTGQLPQAWEIGQQCLTLAHQAHDPAHLLEALLMLGSTGLMVGELRTAHSHFQHCARLCEARPTPTRVVHQVVDPGVVCRCRAAWTLWLLGYADQALATLTQALTLARATAHAFSLAFALLYGAIIHHCRREIGVAQTYVTAMLTLAREHAFVYYVAGGLCLQHLFLAKQGASADLAGLREAVAAWHDQGAPFGFSALYATLAEVYYTYGQMDAGLQALDAALTIIETKTERYYAAEVYRLRGVCLLHHAALDVQQAEACLQHACAIAESQHAKAWELRATVSLSRLWHQQGKSVVARQRLAQIYGWFTEGFDTADLQEAKALLEALRV